jgi:molybdopterin converting factor small subunit
VSIKIHLHKTHRRYTGERETVEVEGRTVGECLQALVRRFPELRAAVFDGNGTQRLHNNIEVYLNLESTYPDELATPTHPGDEIHIAVMLAGG